MSSEEELVAGAVAGDKAALEEVIRLLQDSLYRPAPPPSSTACATPPPC